ncbi:MAG: arginine repressor [Oscillospiraceae bacterium]|nr:arginine repressor [Oscillospiraceae bacterium]MBQ6465892.1 arginine repressor [Oscillospiraceae bacterium]
MKPGRQNVILEIISEQDIETQKQLIQALSERGIRSTQATLSRDIKDMGLVKQLGPNGAYRYVVSGRASDEEARQKLKTIFRESVISYDLAQNLLVIKTLPGLASAACSAIDANHIENLVGSIAGDDTAFLAMRDAEAAKELYRALSALFER